MRLLLLPVLAAVLAVFAVPASAECGGHQKTTDQTAETPPAEPLPTPST